MGKDNTHYSEKSGHKLRSDFARTQEELERKGLHMRHTFNEEINQIARRSMLRDTRDGKR